MNRELANKIADVVLYEGYMLYPYRPSAIKNRQRWTFGILYPPSYPEVSAGTERALMHSECLLRADGKATVEVELRFLHLLAREVAQFVNGKPRPLDSLIVDGHLLESWDEGMARTVKLRLALSNLQHSSSFRFPGSIASKSVYDSRSCAVGLVNQIQHETSGSLSLSGESLGNSIYKLVLEISNTTPLSGQGRDRNSALLRSLLSAHAILAVNGGEFISLLDPPEECRQHVASCNNVGNFPVLVGDPAEHDMLLCSPILLYDYPQVAPESAGDFFDGTEMDEMLTLRVMTLSDDEKQEARMADKRTRELLQRTEQSAREQLIRTHGTIRSMRPLSEL